MGFRSDALELAKLDPKFGFLPLNGNKRPLFSWKDEHPDGFTIEQCLEHQNCEALGVLLGLNLICLDCDGESSIDFLGQQNINFTDDTWTIKRDSHKGFFRYKVLYSPTVEQIEMLPYGEFQAKHLTRSATDDSKGEALEIFAAYPRYAVILGKHPSGDNYYSPENEISVSPFSNEIINELKPYEIKVCSEKDKNSIHFSNYLRDLLNTN